MPESAEVFVEKFNWGSLSGDSKLELIGHARYSTSDLQYNQPIRVFDDLALAHNGVVDQRPPVYWKEYGYELTTANDSELLYQSRYAGNEPLVEFPTATMAVCELSTAKGLRWYRNGGRPMYQVKVSNGYFIMSTKDIALRAGLKSAKKCKPGFVYTPKGSAKLINVEELIP
jgi:glutamine phosphoribosylpyrophosphate amidotransferase